MSDDPRVKRQVTSTMTCTPQQCDVLLAGLHADATSRIAHLDDKAMFLLSVYSVTVYYAEIEVFEFFIHQRGWLWAQLRSCFDPAYPNLPRVTGTRLAPMTGCSRHSALPHDVWRACTGQLRDGETIAIESNEAMEFGTVYEPRERSIFCALVCHVDEPGFYVCARTPWIGVSPDGVAVSGGIRVRGVEYVQDRPGEAIPFDCVLGATTLELKASPFGLKECVQLEHIIQVHHELFVTRRRWGWLQYWHVDKVCLFLVEFCDSFWAWLMKRLDVFLACCKSGEPLPMQYRQTVAHRLQEEWFAEEKRWNRTTPYPGAKPTDDVPPQRPNYWLVFLERNSRCDALQPDRLMDGRAIYPTMKDDPNDPWFAKTWPRLGSESSWKHWTATRPNPSKHHPRVLCISSIIEQE